MDILPTPDYGNGPGYAGINLSSSMSHQSDKFNSGRSNKNMLEEHIWSVQIRYNELPRDVFDVLYAFLLEKVGRLEPFLVHLPQYGQQSATTKTLYSFLDVISRVYSTQLLVTGLVDTQPGNMFLFNNDTLHKVTRVEVPPDSSSYRNWGDEDELLHVWPPIKKNLSLENNATLDFNNIFLKAVPSGDIMYSVDDKALYSIGLNCVEVKNDNAVLI